MAQVPPVPKVATTNSSSTTTGDTAVITTKYGDITLRLFNNVAPKTVANFEKLAKSGFYDQTVFHRIVPGFVIQGGDHNSINGSRNTWGMGDAGYTIPPEFSDLNFTTYTVGMARGQDVNSGSSQFFITVGDASFLNGKYTLFGQVISGQDVVDKIAALPTDSNSQPVNADDARVTTIKILTNGTG
ncbi:MAG: peptidylprolyl isomerase [Thaumarchaeota archaeon]|nr:peptidylprolyl isomerase [Nitrososphaerota archaeon]MDE1872000.1 peptidylprolyl isomerase [Nitrososphaerota archaeon]